MKLGLGKIRDVLKTGSGADMQQEKKEHAKGRSKAGKEETRITENEENKPETNEGNLMEAKMTGQKTKQEPLSPADCSRAKKTGLVFFPAFDWAISPTHPEREERLLYTRDQIFEEGLMDLPEIAEYKPRLAEYRDIARVHFCVPDIKTQATIPHLIAAGSCLVLGDALMRAEVKNAFALVRHARATQQTPSVQQHRQRKTCHGPGQCGCQHVHVNISISGGSYRDCMVPIRSASSSPLNA